MWQFHDFNNDKENMLNWFFFFSAKVISGGNDEACKLIWVFDSWSTSRSRKGRTKKESVHGLWRVRS